jgi:hypothetical protein
MRWIVPFALILQGTVLCGQTATPSAGSKPGAVIFLSSPGAEAVQGNSYSNAAVGFSLSFPSTWKPVRALVGGYTPAKGFDKLFAAGEGLENWLLVSSFKAPQADDTARVGAYLFFAQELQKAGYSVEPKTQELKVNGKKLFRLSYAGTAGKTSFDCALFVTGHNKNVLLFEFCASNKPALESAVATLESLNFTKATKGK